MGIFKTDENGHNKAGQWLSQTVGKVWNDLTGNSQIDKQLAQQKQENQETRDYNLELAKMQNQWNIEQWQRENAYNTPSAQRARLEAAGLNPDLMYGGGGVSNTSASSPQMTAGAPAESVDWTSLGRKKSYGQAILELAQLDNIKAATAKLKSDTKGVDIDNLFKESEKMLGLKLSQQQFEANKVTFERLKQALDEDKLRYEGMSQDVITKQMEHAFKAEALQIQLKQLSKDLEISTFELQKMMEAKVLELRGLELDNTLRKYAVQWEDPGILEALGGKGMRTFLKALMMLLK